MDVVNRPRAKLEVDGGTYNIDTLTNEQNGYYHANKADAHLPLWTTGKPASYWIDLGSTPIGSTADPTPVPAKLWTGTADANENITWASEPIFDGLLLESDANIGSGDLNLSFVDRVILLQQYKLFKAYPNKTGAEIIQTIAAAVGMTAQITGATKLAGAVYSINHIKLHHSDFSKMTTGWDLICYIARQTGNVAFVKGTVVYVQPNNPNPGQAFTVTYGAPDVMDGVTVWKTAMNVKNLKFKHNLLMAKDITIEVQYCHSKKGKSANGSARAGPPRNKNAAGQSNFIFGPYATMNKDEAQAMANRIYREYTCHEYTADFDAPADFTLQPYQTVLFSGSSGQMANTFYINQLHFSMSVAESTGATMAVTVKTHPPENDTAA